MKPTVLALLGPTGSGKTDLVATLDPDRFEVVSCDSRQVYRELEIGTAAPPPEILARIPHHLVGFLRPDESINASTFSTMALDAIRSVLARGKQPIIVGGTGFYYSAIKNGMFSVAVPPEIHLQVERMDVLERRDLLQTLDPTIFISGGDAPRAGKIHPNDDYRIRRALEITLASGRAWTDHWKEFLARTEEGREFVFKGWRIEVELPAYRCDIQKRVSKLIEAGIVEEAARVFQKYGDCFGLRSIGYDVALEASRGRLTLEELAVALTDAHYRYGRKQRTWFKREPELIGGSRNEILAIFSRL